MNRLVVAVLSVAMSCGSAVAAGAEDYVYWRTVDGLDDQCHYLKAVERQLVGTFALDALQGTLEYGHSQDGRMEPEAYEAWLKGLDDQAASAAAIGCTKAAEPYLLTARDRASQLIYQDLLLAFHFNGLAEGDMSRKPLGADEIKAAQGYDQFVQQVYGANFQAFAEAQRQAAGARLPMAETFNPFASFDTLGLDSLEGDTLTDTWNLQFAVGRTLESIHFEVVAEVAGYRVWPEPVAKAGGINALHQSGSTEIAGHVLDEPTGFQIEGGGRMFAVPLLRPDGQIWLMSYGDEAGKASTRQVAASILVRTTPLAGDQTAYAAWGARDWRGLATRFELSLLDAPCLGGPCWAVPDEAKTALLAATSSDYAEFWFGTDRTAGPAVDSESYQRGQFSPWRLFALEGRLE